MQKKRGLLCLAGLSFGIGFVALSALAASLSQELNRHLNNIDLDGYKVKGWVYRPEQREFIVYVHNGDKWLADGAGAPLFPPAAAVVTSAAFIFSDHSTPQPKLYIFKEGSRELFRVAPDTLMDMLKPYR